jgi:hypothetical protein
MTQLGGSGVHIFRGVKIEKKDERFALISKECINLHFECINIQGEKQERKINGDQAPYKQSEYLQPGQAYEAFG